MEISVEKTPKQKISHFVLDNVAFVNITHLPGTDFSLTVDAIKEVNDLAGRNIGIAHVGARNLKSENELYKGLSHLSQEGSTELLIIGGGTPESRIFPYSDVVYDYIKKHNFEFEMWCAVHPQEEKFDNVLNSKYKKYIGGYNQLCLNPNLLKKWNSKTRICIPTRCSAQGLWKYMNIVGLTQTFPYLLGNWRGAFYLDSNGFNTYKFIKEVGNIKQLHLYNFGRLDSTLERLL